MHDWVWPSPQGWVFIKPHWLVEWKRQNFLWDGIQEHQLAIWFWHLSKDDNSILFASARTSYQSNVHRVHELNWPTYEVDILNLLAKNCWELVLLSCWWYYQIDIVINPYKLNINNLICLQFYINQLLLILCSNGHMIFAITHIWGCQWKHHISFFKSFVWTRNVLMVKWMVNTQYLVMLYHKYVMIVPLFTLEHMERTIKSLSFILSNFSFWEYANVPLVGFISFKLKWNCLMWNDRPI
jgi:hypothetical protein